ncbi:hypothetical protein ONZ45_g3342 [Pleurotus djamor]|nr:hypothetical protein ONZ45_g3342 [Pleurotus djamor]
MVLMRRRAGDGAVCDRSRRRTRKVNVAELLRSQALAFQMPCVDESTLESTTPKFSDAIVTSQEALWVPVVSSEARNNTLLAQTFTRLRHGCLVFAWFMRSLSLDSLPPLLGSISVRQERPRA